MKHSPILIVPGYRGSGEGHWQTWMEHCLPEARRVDGIDWDSPVIDRWSGAIRLEIDREFDASLRKPWIVAHSFGCLAGLSAAASRPEQVAGLMLVAPADPERFAPSGLRGDWPASIAHRLPQERLEFPSVVVASNNDPWMNFEVAADWAERWGSVLVNLGAAGHINADSGYGPWPEGLELLRAMQRANGGYAPSVIPGDHIPEPERRGRPFRFLVAFPRFRTVQGPELQTFDSTELAQMNCRVPRKQSRISVDELQSEK